MSADVTRNTEVELLLDCALAHKADNLRAFLTQVDLPRSGTKDVLRGIHDRMWIDNLLPEHQGKYLLGIRPLTPGQIHAIQLANSP